MALLFLGIRGAMLAVIVTCCLELLVVMFVYMFTWIPGITVVL